MSAPSQAPPLADFPSLAPAVNDGSVARQMAAMMTQMAAVTAQVDAMRADALASRQEMAAMAAALEDNAAQMQQMEQRRPQVDTGGAQLVDKPVGVLAESGASVVAEARQLARSIEASSSDGIAARIRALSRFDPAREESAFKVAVIIVQAVANPREAAMGPLLCAEVLSQGLTFRAVGRPGAAAAREGRARGRHPGHAADV